MGMFDYLRCEYPLPLAGANALEFQTKDTPSQYCVHYTIRQDGSMWHKEFHSDESETLCCMTGEVRFYSYDGKRSPDWIEFLALFIKGQVVHIEQVAPARTED